MVHGTADREPYAPPGLLKTIADDWNWQALIELEDGPRRQAELARALPPMSQSSANEHLHRLMSAGLVTQQQVSVRPFGVAFKRTLFAGAACRVRDAAGRWEVGAPPGFARWMAGGSTLELLDDPWALPIMRRVACGSHRRSEIRSYVPCLTEKTLDGRLGRLEGAGILVVERQPGFPPHADYVLTALGRAAAAVALLASDCEWKWGQPARPTVACDLAGYVRLVAPLVRLARQASGILELSIRAPAAIEPSILIQASKGRIDVLPRSQSEPTVARVEAVPLAWCDALSSGATAGLQCTGSEALIRDVVRGFHGAVAGIVG